ncbi:MAG: alpha-glucosidase [Sphaerochaetaceae bacterium]|nr:alpha-glucosidase [Sphaerochaetaceae bacterium]
MYIVGFKKGTANLKFSSVHGGFKIIDKSKLSGVLDLSKNYRDGDDFVGIKKENSVTTITYSFSKSDAFSLIIKDDDPVYGCGEMYSFTDLRGRCVPIWVQEQGLGRGFNAVKIAVDIAAHSGGTQYTTYYSIPSFVTKNLSFTSNARGHSLFDFKKGYDEITFYERSGCIKIKETTSLKESVAFQSEMRGIQPKMPSWCYRGLSVSLQGGSDEVDKKLEKMESLDGLINSIWLQDWCGQKITSFGHQLKWNWKMDEKHYPLLRERIKQWKDRGIRTMGYINTYVGKDYPMYEEAKDLGFLVLNKKGEVYDLEMTGFKAGMIDFTNPSAREWMKDIIKNNLIREGFSGWMADFGEYQPTDCVLFNREDPYLVHNQIPELWAKLNREAIDEMGMSDEIVFFCRSGYSDSQKYCPLFWCGDQMVNLNKDDGLSSVVPAYLSLGLMGINNIHSDIGGYTSLGWVKRTKEMMKMWAALSAFTPFMRTHESNRPDKNIQFYDDEDLLNSLKKDIELHNELSDVFMKLDEEYRESGIPSMRQCDLQDPSLDAKRTQFFLGDDILVLPLLDKRQKSVCFEIGEGRWLYEKTGKTYERGHHKIKVKEIETIYLVRVKDLN